MEKEVILKNIESNLKKYLRNEKHILEAFNVIAFTKKKKNIDNLVQYITATSILLLIYILGFTVSSIFNCILAVNTSVNPYSIFNLIVLSLNVLFFSVITGPINFSYILMIYNDFFKTLQSDLSNLFFFLNNPSKKISFLLSSIFFSFLTHFILLISIFTLGVIFSFIKIKFIIPVMYLIVFFLFINLIAFNITAFFVFIKKVETFINSILEYENLQYNYLGGDAFNFIMEYIERYFIKAYKDNHHTLITFT